MKLSEIFNQLTHGELSQISLGGSENGEINESNHNRIIPHVNLGLTSLHKRFALKEGRVSFELSTLGEVYDLQRPDILKIERVITEKGYDLGVNNFADAYSCSTPGLGTLRVPAIIINKGPDLREEYITSTLEVVYRANHVTIPEDTEPNLYEVVLPYSHLEALLYFIASRIHNPIGMTNEFHAGNSWAAKYEMECARLEGQNIQIDQGTQYDRIRRNGWV